MELNKLSSIVTKKKKRRGRGYGSGKGGHTVGYGQKGQGSRSGFKRLRSWIRDSKVVSIPKLRGVGRKSAGSRCSKKKKLILNIGNIANEFEAGEIVNRKSLQEKKLIPPNNRKFSIKILGEGRLEKKITLQGVEVSETAEEKIRKAGGQVIGNV